MALNIKFVSRHQQFESTRTLSYLCRPALEMTTVLFVCTGNYYRSRAAEILFNHYAGRYAVEARALSRGFRLNPGKNKGPLSPHTKSYLDKLGISHNGEPTKLELGDLESSQHIFLLDEKEHRQMIRRHFPHWEDRVTFWSFEDDYIADPQQVLPSLHQRVEALVKSLGECDNMGADHQ